MHDLSRLEFEKKAADQIQPCMTQEHGYIMSKRQRPECLSNIR